MDNAVSVLVSPGSIEANCGCDKALEANNKEIAAIESSVPRKSLRETRLMQPLLLKGLRGIEWANLGSEGRRKLCIS